MLNKCFWGYQVHGCFEDHCNARLCRSGVEPGSSRCPMVDACFERGDLFGPTPRSKDGIEWIVTWVDRTSKTIVAAARAHKNISAEDLAKLTCKEIFCRFGIPRNLTMDNDVRFVSSLWKSLWHICGTKLRFTSSYHPQANPAERANCQVLEALRAAVTTGVQYDEWDRGLPHITFGLNNHIVQQHA